MWREHHRLAAAVRRMLHLRSACQRVVVTMTGEIADCFRSREHGVHAIVTAVEEASPPDSPMSRGPPRSPSSRTSQCPR